MENKVVAQNIPEAKKEADLKELLLNIQALVKYLLKKWWVFAIAAAIGMALGFVYFKTRKISYQAESTFVLESGKTSDGVSGLAILGIDGMGSSKSGLFDESDNIMWLYQTNKMLKKCLLTKSIKKDGSEIMMINWFINSTYLKKEMEEKAPGVFKIKFTPEDDSITTSAEKNGVINWCVNVLRSHISIQKVEKTKNIVSVSVSSYDENFSKEFNDLLVSTVNKFYVDTKTEKASNEVAYLQYKLDSLRSKLNSSMVQAAVATDNVPYANPNLITLKVAPQRKTVDVQLESTMYSEMVRNLEVSKMSLAKVTPLLQVIEAPVYPLRSSFPDVKMVLIKAVLMSMVLPMLVLVAMYFYKKIMTP